MTLNLPYLVEEGTRTNGSKIIQYDAADSDTSKRRATVQIDAPREDGTQEAFVVGEDQNRRVQTVKQLGTFSTEDEARAAALNWMIHVC